MIKKAVFIAIILILKTGETHASVDFTNGYTFGPVFNWHFGGGKNFRTIGFNVYYWDLQGTMPLSFGGGYEMGGDGHHIVFIEGQTGIVVLGLSSGILYDFSKGLGFQGSIWGSLLAGYNARFRFIERPFLASGWFISIPVMEHEGLPN